MARPHIRYIGITGNNCHQHMTLNMFGNVRQHQATLQDTAEYDI